MERLWIIAQNLLTLAVLTFGWSFSRPAAHPLLTGIGGGLLLLGAVFGLAGARALGRNRSPHPRPPESGRLVSHGIYRRVRHPLYASLILLAAGWALARTSWPAGLAGLALAALLVAKARLEETFLRLRFPEYADYARRTWRFFPWIW